MHIAQGLLGIASLALGVLMIAMRRRLASRARRGGRQSTAVATVWVVCGALFVTNGSLQLVMAVSG